MNQNIYPNILSTIGETPMISLKKIYKNFLFNIYAKLEGFNPGGSIKDRPASYILSQATIKGKIQKNTTIIESSSGNMAIGMAQYCLYNNLSFVCVVDTKTTQTNIQI